MRLGGVSVNGDGDSFQFSERMWFAGVVDQARDAALQTNLAETLGDDFGVGTKKEFPRGIVEAVSGNHGHRYHFVLLFIWGCWQHYRYI